MMNKAVNSGIFFIWFGYWLTLLNYKFFDYWVISRYIVNRRKMKK